MKIALASQALRYKDPSDFGKIDAFASDMIQKYGKTGGWFGVSTKDAIAKVRAFNENLSAKETPVVQTANKGPGGKKPSFEDYYAEARKAPQNKAFSDDELRRRRKQFMTRNTGQIMADFFDPWEKSGLRAATDDFYDPWSSRSQGRVDNQSIVQSKAPSSNYEDIYKELGYYGYMGVPDKEAMKPFTAALKTAPFQIANGIATFIDQINELSSGIPREKEDRIAWRAARYFDDLANKNAPDFGQGSPEYYVYSTLSSVFQNAPGMVLGTLTGSRVLGLGLMGTNVAGQKYYELTEKKGVDPWKARMISGLYGPQKYWANTFP
jgi:hypothetical protein